MLKGAEYLLRAEKRRSFGATAALLPLRQDQEAVVANLSGTFDEAAQAKAQAALDLIKRTRDWNDMTAENTRILRDRGILPLRT
ncbi:MAG: hypothetical protein DI551_06685 [Micavibrio aeruginosavorus]|uniref:Uncharacterized protein n=1 Tax=Micavibrio aeruginosavorus TaxID=349221 RepID=A0A2W5Q2X5_9BACT|nr:MAG: hypothetical protein DI551_06685 [Micavibrio aeruginosavorus]